MQFVLPFWPLTAGMLYVLVLYKLAALVMALAIWLFIDRDEP